MLIATLVGMTYDVCQWFLPEEVVMLDNREPDRNPLLICGDDDNEELEELTINFWRRKFSLTSRIHPDTSIGSVVESNKYVN